MSLLISWVASLFASHVFLASAVQLKQSERIGQLPSIDTDDALVDELLLTPSCTRKGNCGVLSEALQPPVRVSCKKGDLFFAHDSLFIPNQHGRSLVYCSVPKVATSYMFWVMGELNLETQHGPRNSAYKKVHEIVSDQDEDTIEDLCNAYSFVIIRNPWDRLVSGYIDKVASKRLMNHPPGFHGFMKTIQKANSSELNHHFRPTSLLCSTTGEQRQKYDKVIKLEGNMQVKLENVFVDELGLPKDKVRRVLEAGVREGASHNTTTSGFATKASENSGLDRTSFYFGQSDPHIVEEVYKDDIEFGHYKFGGLKKLAK